MVQRRRKVVWSLRSRRDRTNIFRFWNQHNQSTAYSKRLFSLFHRQAKQLEEHAFIGFETNHCNVRGLVIENYILYYEVHNEHIVVLTVWDSRRNPDELKLP